jgi:hypothetical protein
MVCYKRWQCSDDRGGCCGLRHNGSCTCTVETWKGRDGYSFGERFVHYCECPACCPSDYESCSEYEDTIPGTWGEKQMITKRKTSSNAYVKKLQRQEKKEKKKKRQEEHEEAESAERKRQRKVQESDQSGCRVM